MNLLTQTRKINQVLYEAGGNAVNFKDIADILSVALAANTFVLERTGGILGYALVKSWPPSPGLAVVVEQGWFPEEVGIHLASLKTSWANSGAIFAAQEKLFSADPLAAVPVGTIDSQLGSLVLSRSGTEFAAMDLILAEYGAAVVAMEVLRSRSLHMEQEVRERAEVRLALNTLSYSELEAIENILEALDGKNEGILVASDIADRIGITRSVFVNALRKFESAGIVASRSLGMKGTHIKVLKTRLYDELEMMREGRNTDKVELD